MKPIFLTKEDKEALKKELEAAIENGCLVDGSFSFQKKYQCTEKDKKMTIYYTSSAYCKMWYLIQYFKSEIGWHGLIKRLSENEFLVYDILVFKQNVTGSTVTPDAEDYTRFLMDLTDDEAENMHMHGHSHVNMGVTPSSVDLNYQRDLIATMNNKGFYLFQIWNKSMDVTSTLYDFETGILYEKKDILVDVVDDDAHTISSFVKNAETLVVDTSPKYNTTPNYSQYRYGGYQRETYSRSAEKPVEEKTTKKTSSKKTNENVSPYSGSYGSNWQNRIYEDDDTMDAYLERQFGLSN